MRLSKNDPIYYRNKINKLIKEAKNNGIEVYFDIYCGAEVLTFKCVGTTACVKLYELKKEE